MDLSIKYIDENNFGYIQEVNDFLNSWNDKSEFIVLKSSGSTGVQKEIKLQKSAMMASSEVTGKFFDFKQGETILLNLSPEYIAGKMILVRAICFNLKILALQPSKNPLLELPANTKIDFAAFVPYQVEHILNDDKSLRLFRTIKNVIIGGGAIHLDLEKRIAAEHNRAYSTFGMTETISHFALRKIGEDEHYQTLPGWNITQDDRKCLKIAANKVLEDNLVTNDIIEMEGSDRFKWKGRFDFVINSAGIKIFPEEVEKVLNQHLIPETFYVTSKKDNVLGEKVVLVTEKRIDIVNLMKKIQGDLKSYQYPKEIVEVKEIEKTPTGKIKRKRL